jgi:hypothetical protein
MGTEITQAEREAISGALSLFMDSRLMEGDRVVRVVRWTEHASLPPTEKAEIFVQGDPPIRGLATRPGTRPWSGEFFDEVRSAQHRAQRFAKLAFEFFALVFRRPYQFPKPGEEPERDPLAVLTFEDLDVHLQRIAEAMAEGVREENAPKIKAFQYARDRWILDIPGDTEGVGQPSRWVRISDEVLNDLAHLASSQRVALDEGLRFPIPIAQTFGGLHNGIASGEVVEATRVHKGSPMAPVPVCRVKVPDGTQLALPMSADPREQIGKDGSVPIERVDNGQEFRAFVMLTDMFVHRPRDAYGGRPEQFEVNISAMLERYGLSPKGPVRKQLTRAIDRLSGLLVQAAKVNEKEWWEVSGERWEPLLTKYEKKILGSDGKEYRSGSPRYRLAGTIVAALSDARHARHSVQIPRASIGQEPETLLTLVGLATVHRENAQRMFANPRREYRLASKAALVQGCFRAGIAAGNTVDRQFERLRDLAEEHRYGAIMVAPSGEVVVEPDPWFLDVYASFATSKARHTRAHYAKKARAKRLAK